MKDIHIGIEADRPGPEGKPASPKHRVTPIALWLIGALVALMAVLPAHAERRVALVIGNSNYKNTVELTNPSNDATDMAAALRSLGFEVIAGTNMDRRDTEDALQRFARLAHGADAALFFYAGHGMQFRGRNYLMPVDAKLQDEISPRYEMTSLDDVKEALQASAGVKIMILDACRDNPLAEHLSRSIASKTRDVPVVQGFTPFAPDDGMLVEYSTQPNQVAADGGSHNSPFTTALLAHVREPGLEVGTMFRRVGNDVYKATNGAQSPELSISLHADFYLNQSFEKIDLAPRSPELPSAPPATAAPVAVAPAPVWAPIKIASAPASASPEPAALTRSINIELRRIGCYSGAADADWTSAGVKRAVGDAIRYASLAELPASPSEEFLSFLKGQTSRLCPVVCSASEIERDGQCVLKTCRPDEVLGPKGECRSRPTVRLIPTPTLHREAPRPQVSRRPAVSSHDASKAEPTVPPAKKYDYSGPLPPTWVPGQQSITFPGQGGGSMYLGSEVR